ncbi:zinc finger and SCAN domain-containing protein 5B-like [Bos indicus]|uniref:Zinc finger and SCAN domain-containing protein 5B-like n=1 Tax=Bos indicus TaxID=9915 RepID=A0ABM4QYW5_BOSIN
MVDRLVLEQFVMCMLQDIHILVKSSGAETCKDLEEVLRKKQKLTKWAVVRVQGKDFLMPVSGVEMLGSEVSERHSEEDQAREPQSTVSVIPPDEGQQESRDGQHLPGAKDLLRGQGQKALLLETILETVELKGQTPSKENLEKDLVKDTGVTRTLSAQEPELLQDHEGDVSTPNLSR